MYVNEIMQKDECTRRARGGIAYSAFFHEFADVPLEVTFLFLLDHSIVLKSDDDCYSIAPFLVLYLLGYLLDPNMYG
jgi:hypothetical protein